MKHLVILGLGVSAITSIANEVLVEDLRLVEEQEFEQSAWDEDRPSGTFPSAYTDSSYPNTFTNDSFPNAVLDGNFPDMYTNSSFPSSTISAFMPSLYSSGVAGEARRQGEVPSPQISDDIQP